ncbi:MAG TPA: hypothetical protein DDW52_30465, partial [Planctomycetaceae bacterium]|nr:hypothetical protein [Planctomycetaceae bacterium]
MSQYNNSGSRTYTAGEAVPLYRRVHLVGDEVFIAGATDFDIGTLARPSFEAGEPVPVVNPNQGTVMMVAETAVSPGQKLYAAANGMVGTDSANAFLGICIIGCDGAEEYIEVQRLSATGSVVLTPEATTFDALNALPTGGFGNDDDQILVTDGYLAGMLLGKDSGTWVVQGQWQVPKLDAEITQGDVPHTAIVAALATQAVVGGSYAYQVYRGGRFEQDVVYPSGTIFRNTLSSSGGTTTINNSGVTLPADATGLLQNDGAGNLSWQTVSTQNQYTHTESTPATVWAVNHNLGAPVDSVNIYVGGQKVG